MTEEDLMFTVIRLDQIRDAQKLKEFIFMLRKDMQGDLLDTLLEVFEDD